MEEKEEEGGGGDCARQGRGNCKILKEKEEGEPGENIWMHDQAPLLAPALPSNTATNWSHIAFNDGLSL